MKHGRTSHVTSGAAHGQPLCCLPALHCPAHPSTPAGPCEALLTTANLLIVLGLRDALRQQQQQNPSPNSAGNSDAGTASSTSSSTSSSSGGPLADPPSTAAAAALDAADASAPEEPQPELWTPPHPPSSTGPPSHSLAAAGPRAPGSPHTLPPLDPSEPPPLSPTGRHPPQLHKRGPGIVRVCLPHSMRVRPQPHTPTTPTALPTLTPSQRGCGRSTQSVRACAVRVQVAPMACHRMVAARRVMQGSSTGVLLGRV